MAYRLLGSELSTCHCRQSAAAGALKPLCCPWQVHVALRAAPGPPAGVRSRGARCPAPPRRRAYRSNFRPGAVRRLCCRHHYCLALHRLTADCSSLMPDSKTQQYSSVHGTSPPLLHSPTPASRSQCPVATQRLHSLNLQRRLHSTRRPASPGGPAMAAAAAVMPHQPAK